MKLRDCFCRGSMLLAVVMLAGCGSGYSLAPVSGTVTNNGEPVAGITVVFYPKGTDNNPNPGPFSKAVTDDQGKYTLVTRDGDNGAVIGDHRVAIEMGGGGEAPSEEALAAAKSNFEDAQRNDPGGVAQAQKQYERLLKQRQRMANIPEAFLNGKVIAASVPSGGTDSADFDLATD